MDEPYRHEWLPLNTPDDDRRWAAFRDIFDFAFLDRRASEATLETYRANVRDGAFLSMITTEGPGLDGREAVAGFASIPSTVNSGKGPVKALIANTIAVRHSHRRRGLFRTMMTEQLQAARDKGFAHALLTASEATIYGRFGFGVATRTCPIEIDTRRFAFRDGVPVASGAIEHVHPGFLTDHFTRINEAHQRAHRGAVGRTRGHKLSVTGQWSQKDEAPSRSLRAVVHFDDGQPDGYAVYEFKGWDPPVTVDIFELCAADPAVERALWQALVNMDLIERLTYDFSRPGDALALALADQWAVKVKETHDNVWLRILDLEQAVAERAFESDGELTLQVADAQGWCNGVWHLTVSDGEGHITRAHDAEADVTLGVDTLARLWFGDRRAGELAEAGLIQGSADGVRALTRLFATQVGPYNLSRF